MIFHHLKFSSLCRHKHKFAYITTSQRLFGRFSGKFALFSVFCFYISSNCYAIARFSCHYNSSSWYDTDGCEQERERNEIGKNTHSMRIGGGRQQWIWVKLISRQEREEMRRAWRRRRMKWHKNEKTQHWSRASRASGKYIWILMDYLFSKSWQVALCDGFSSCLSCCRRQIVFHVLFTLLPFRFSSKSIFRVQICSVCAFVSTKNFVMFTHT